MNSFSSSESGILRAPEAPKEPNFVTDVLQFKAAEDAIGATAERLLSDADDNSVSLWIKRDEQEMLVTLSRVTYSVLKSENLTMSGPRRTDHPNYYVIDYWAENEQGNMRHHGRLTSLRRDRDRYYFSEPLQQYQSELFTHEQHVTNQVAFAGALAELEAALDQA